MVFTGFLRVWLSVLQGDFRQLSFGCTEFCGLGGFLRLKAQR